MNLNYGRRLSPEELMNQQKEEPTPKEEVTTAQPSTPPAETESETFEDQDGQRFGEIHGVQG